MESWHNTQTDGLCEALLTLKNKEECYAFLEDAMTIREILDISQRLEVAKMLSRGKSYSEIARTTGASTATISRVSKCREYGSGGYNTVIERCGENKDE
ncbi:MAG: helix-turn-helix domain-containing protein [Clostridia bacterium]|nr:helix-turn-helix domain-containing protein [Clostridia bacterium]